MLSSLLGILWFGIGIWSGILVGFFLFIYKHPNQVQDPMTRTLHELDTMGLEDIRPEIPMWVKNPDYVPVDWLNKFILQMWPYIDKAVCCSVRTTSQTVFKKYIGKYFIEAIEFESLTLGTLPPTISGVKVVETNEKEVVVEMVIRWAGNPGIALTLTVLSMRLTIQLLDMQIFASPRITLKPLVPTFPCFASIVVSLMEKPHVDFGMKILGGDLMAIPGLYQFVQETITRKVASLYLWPQTLELRVLDASTVSVKKPVGILHVKVVRAVKLSKKDILGSSDPYVKLRFSGERFSVKRTSVKMKNLNPHWNETFKLIVKDPQIQALELQVYDWDKLGGHDRIGMHLVPLKLLTPNETKEFTLDLVKNMNPNDLQNKKRRGQLVVELTYVHFKLDSVVSIERGSDGEDSIGVSMLSVMIKCAKDVEGEYHNNPYVLVHFRGEKRKTKTMKKTRDPLWNEEFQFVLEEAPNSNDKIRVNVLSKRTGFRLRSTESLGFVEIDLRDVVHNGRINSEYHLINSKNGKIHVELSWKMA